MPRVVHFEIPVDDPDRAIRFYTNVFGWKIDKWEGGGQDYWLVTTGEDEPGIDGGLMPRGETTGTVNTVSVPSVDDYTPRIEEAGGKLAMPKIAVPGQGYAAYFVDPEGNAFGIFETDTTAQ